MCYDTLSRKYFSGGNRPVKSVISFLRNEEGAELAEYAVGTAIVVAIAIIVYQILGDAIANKMNAVVDDLNAPPPAASPAPTAP